MKIGLGTAGAAAVLAAVTIAFLWLQQQPGTGQAGKTCAAPEIATAVQQLMAAESYVQGRAGVKMEGSDGAVVLECLKQKLGEKDYSTSGQANERTITFTTPDGRTAAVALVDGSVGMAFGAGSADAAFQAAGSAGGSGGGSGGGGGSSGGEQAATPAPTPEEGGDGTGDGTGTGTPNPTPLPPSFFVGVVGRNYPPVIEALSSQEARDAGIAISGTIYLDYFFPNVLSGFDAVIVAGDNCCLTGDAYDSIRQYAQSGKTVVRHASDCTTSCSASGNLDWDFPYERMDNTDVQAIIQALKG